MDFQYRCAITPAARTEEASINVPMLVIDAIAAAVAIALFPSNYEIVGMGDDSITASDDQSPNND